MYFCIFGLFCCNVMEETRPVLLSVMVRLRNETYKVLERCILQYLSSVARPRQTEQFNQDWIRQDILLENVIGFLHSFCLHVEWNSKVDPLRLKQFQISFTYEFLSCLQTSTMIASRTQMTVLLKVWIQEPWKDKSVWEGHNPDTACRFHRW